MSIHQALPIVPLLLATLVVSGCDTPEYDVGPTRSETRKIGSFDSIDLDGSARLIIDVGASESLSVEGPARILERVKTETHGDTLRIRTRAKDWVWAHGQPRVVIKVTLPRLKKLELEGGNDVRLTGFKGGDSRFEVRGAAHLIASGEVDELTVDMEGAGFADFSELVAREAHVTVDGIGRVLVNPKDRLNATMNGIGSILYAGSPREVNTHMRGFGSISQRDVERSERKEHHKDWGRRRDKDADQPQPRVEPQVEPQVEPEVDPKPEINPEELQPEVDNRPKKVVDMTEVI